jgi:hypothetical protein
MKRVKRALFSITLIIFFGAILIFTLPYFLESSYSVKESVEASVPAPEVTKSLPPPVTHLPTPPSLKAIYMTACVAGTPSWRESLEKMINSTELNAIVIDVKDYTGTISFEDPTLQPTPGPGCRVKDMQAFIEELHQNNIYVIGRVTVFQDPFYSKLHPELAIQSKSTGGPWKDPKGLAYIDVGAKPYWDYIVNIAKDSYNIGFDEINFDYVRYPSDGNLKDMNTTWTIGTSTKAEMVKDFFSYLHTELSSTGVVTSADLFGLTTVAEGDLGIGQVLTNALPYFNYVDPMVYPSHFAAGSDGYQNPAAHPYQIIDYSMSGGVAKEQAQEIAEGVSTSTPSKLRPWLQDFDLGAPYGVPEVQAQIKATYDVGLTSWLVWDAANKYTPGAFLPQ